MGGIYGSQGQLDTSERSTKVLHLQGPERTVLPDKPQGNIHRIYLVLIPTNVLPKIR